MQKVELSATPRAITGRSVRTLRRQGILPAVVYSRNQSQSISLSLKDFERVYQQAGESTLVYLKLGDQALPVIIHDIARDPVSDGFIHADFYQVDLKKKTTAEVHLVFSGESEAVKGLGGILVKNLNSLEVEALPQDLPHELSVDISGLRGFDDQILVKDVALPAGVEVLNNSEEIIILVQEPISQEELDKQLAGEPGVEPSAVEVIGQEEEPAEGATGEEDKPTEATEEK